MDKTIDILVNLKTKLYSNEKIIITVDDIEGAGGTWKKSLWGPNVVTIDKDVIDSLDLNEVVGHELSHDAGSEDPETGAGIGDNAHTIGEMLDGRSKNYFDQFKTPSEKEREDKAREERRKINREKILKGEPLTPRL